MGSMYTPPKREDNCNNCGAPLTPSQPVCEYCKTSNKNYNIAIKMQQEKSDE